MNLIKETFKTTIYTFKEIFSISRDYFFKNIDKFVNILIYAFLVYLGYIVFKELIRQLIKIRLRFKNDNLNIDRLITLSSVFNSILKISFGFIFILLVLKEFEIKITPILTGAGIFGAAFIYLFQSIIQDIIKGWLLIFEDQVRKGEWVNINNTYIGKVIEFNLRHLVLRDRERNLIFIPNSQISTIVNLSREGKKQVIKIRFKKDIDLNKFLEELNRIIKKFEEENKDVKDIKIENDINFEENFLEAFVSFKTRFLLGEELKKNLKIKIFEELKDNIISIS